MKIGDVPQDKGMIDGDLCEIATLAAMDAGVEVTAVFDEETNRQQLAGAPILRDLAELAAAKAVVITDTKDPQATYDRMATLLGSEKVSFPSLLRLSTRRRTKLSATAG